MSDENCAPQQLFPVGPQAFCETPNITSMSLPQNVVGPQRRKCVAKQDGHHNANPKHGINPNCSRKSTTDLLRPPFSPRGFRPRTGFTATATALPWSSAWTSNLRVALAASREEKAAVWVVRVWQLGLTGCVDITIYIPSEYIHWPWYKMFSNTKDRNTVVQASDDCPRLQEQVHLAELWVQSSTPSFSWRGCASVGNDTPTRRAASTIPPNAMAVDIAIWVHVLKFRHDPIYPERQLALEHVTWKPRKTRFLVSTKPYRPHIVYYNDVSLFELPCLISAYPYSTLSKSVPAPLFTIP